MTEKKALALSLLYVKARIRQGLLQWDQLTVMVYAILLEFSPLCMPLRHRYQ